MEQSATPRIEELLVHGAWLRRLASGLVHTDGDADDLVQETWLAALVRGPERGEQATGWLARVLRNQAVSRTRRGTARTWREADRAKTESLPSAATLAGRADMSRRLVELVLELESDTQRILLARYFEGLSSAEIARRLDRPAGTVRSQLKRGLDELRGRLDAENDENRERWLSALAPLVLPRPEGGALAWVLALSTGARVAVGLVMASLVAGVWWFQRGPEVGPPPVIAAEDSEARDLVATAPPVEEPDPVEAAEPAPERTVVAAEPVVPMRPIEGRLVHPETGEPVVWYELGLVPAGMADAFRGEATRESPMPDLEGVELVRTDADGRFVTTVPYARGDYALVPIEDWRFALPRMDGFRIREPRPPFDVAHEPAAVGDEAAEPHVFELETGPVFTIDCPKALELGAESMVAVYSYIDHFPPGYFRPSPLQVDPIPFVRMHTDFAPSFRKKANNLRLVSIDGLWSGSVPMQIPDSIATQHVIFELEARALVDVDLDFGGRKPPFALELHYWQGAVDPTAPDAPEPDIVEIQAKFDGTLLDEAIVKYVRTGLVTLGIEANTNEYWFQVVELKPGRNTFEAVIQPRVEATGRIEGRVVYVGEEAPEPIVRVLVNGKLDGQTTYANQDLVFERQGGIWVAEFTFTHLPVSTHSIWFDKGGPATRDPKAFVVEPSRMRVEPDGPPVEFELFTDLTETKLVVRATDAVTGEKVKAFSIAVVVPDLWLHSRDADAKLGRASLKLLGELEGGFVCVGAEGYQRRDVALTEAVETSKGLELKLPLTPGWGGPLYAANSETEEPLAGVRVLLDGADAGVTNDAGHLDVKAEKTPERVEFVLEGYEVTWQGGWIDGDGEVMQVGPKPLDRYLSVRMAPSAD